MPNKDNFPAVFDKLKAILQEVESHFVVKVNTADNYYLDTHYVEQYKKELFFGVVQIKKNYVSFHLMPVYMYPGLLDDISPALKKRMQGKSCFNFTTISDEMAAELRNLTQKGMERFRQENMPKQV